ncbi:unnamed protein product [Pleuronectes platessa]|uniref:Uncharacterized protein n=1 Tax=Pleuronectes platessa TaxID=8262 RepID=A0A9N7ULS2_PLEPL|nr:unnamed protein product [Pleuronectes platessa]
MKARGKKELRCSQPPAPMDPGVRWSSWILQLRDKAPDGLRHSQSGQKLHNMIIHGFTSPDISVVGSQEKVQSSRGDVCISRVKAAFKVLGLIDISFPQLLPDLTSPPRQQTDVGAVAEVIREKGPTRRPEWPPLTAVPGPLQRPPSAPAREVHRMRTSGPHTEPPAAAGEKGDGATAPQPRTVPSVLTTNITSANDIGESQVYYR